MVATLLRGPDKVWTGSELARAAGVTPRWAIATLTALEAEGVVQPSSCPPSVLWKVNRKHVLVDLMASLAKIDARAQQALRAELQGTIGQAKPLKALWFGSTARGEEEPGSDVDVLVVVKDAAAKRRTQEILARAAGPFYWRFGNRLAPIVLTRREFERRRGFGFVREALSYGIWICGGP